VAVQKNSIINPAPSIAKSCLQETRSMTSQASKKKSKKKKKKLTEKKKKATKKKVTFLLDEKLKGKKESKAKVATTEKKVAILMGKKKTKKSKKKKRSARPSHKAVATHGNNKSARMSSKTDISVGGFKIIELYYNFERTAGQYATETSTLHTATPHYIFVKRHHYSSKVKDSDGNYENRVLFVANVPMGISTQEAEHVLTCAFNGIGEVENVKIATLTRSLVRCAHVLFKSTQAVTKAVAGKSLGIHCLSKFEAKAEEAEDTPGDVAPVDEMHYGLKAMYTALLRERQDTARVAAAASDYLRKFEEREAEVEEERKARAAAAAADGFTMVTGKRKAKGDPGGGADNKKSRKKKKKTKVHDNFYRFQKTERKRDQLRKIRDQFEEDKKRVLQMKLARGL